MNYREFYFEHYKKLHHISLLTNKRIFILEVNNRCEIILCDLVEIAGERVESPSHMIEGKIITTHINQRWTSENISIDKINLDLSMLKKINIKIDNNYGYIYIETPSA